MDVGLSFGEQLDPDCRGIWFLLIPRQSSTASLTLKDDAAMSSLTATIPQRAHLLADYRAQVISLISNYQ